MRTKYVTIDDRPVMIDYKNDVVIDGLCVGSLDRLLDAKLVKLAPLSPLDELFNDVNPSGAYDKTQSDLREFAGAYPDEAKEIAEILVRILHKVDE